MDYNNEMMIRMHWYRIFVFAVVSIFGMELSAQLRLELLSFEESPFDISARTHQRNDINGDPAALLKVFVPRLKDGLSITSPVKIGDEEYAEGMLFVYLGDGSRRVTVRHPDFLPFDYSFENPLKGKSVYTLTLKVPDSYFSLGQPSSTDSRTDSIMNAAKLLWMNNDFEGAAASFRELPENAEAQFYMGKYHDMKEEYAKAAKCYRTAAAKDYAEAATRLGYMYESGAGVGPDDKEAVRWWRAAAEKGEANAQNRLAIAYMSGEGGMAADKYEAAKWFRLAAEKGNSSAQFNIGLIYFHGNGVPQDHKEAMKWFRKAAEQGQAGAQTYVGEMYCNGQGGVKQDHREAVKWLRKASEQGSARAWNDMGNMYYNGWGVPQDFSEALEWYGKAAEAGDVAAQCRLGYMYAMGKGTDGKDESAAAEWYRKAAMQGSPVGQYNLGLMYESGMGVPKDFKEAKKWLKASAEQGYEAAEAMRRY